PPYPRPSPPGRATCGPGSPASWDVSRTSPTSARNCPGPG
ncbi:SARP family transcriptional regulator, partial [Mesorhizobium sp. B2-3-3]